MKKILIAFAVFASLQIADAQVKSSADIKKAVESAEAAAADSKKATKVATWTKVADAYINAYTAPMGQGWRGANQQELLLILGNDRPTGSEQVVVSGAPYIKDIYPTRNYYYNANGQLEIIEVTQPIYEDALAKALDAYKKAYEVDAKGSKTKDIAAGIANVSSKYLEEGINVYMLGNAEKASRLFEAAADAAATAPNSMVDSMAIYNAGFTAYIAGDNARAKGFFEKAVEIGYYEDGESYVKLADVYTKLGDTLASKGVLEEGFAKFPQSQSVLIGLINYYISSGENPDQLFALLDKAKANEPGNASLYYVEGDIHSKLGNKEAAIAAYQKSSEIDPTYAFGHIGSGLLYYNEAVKVSEMAAQEMDDTKYMALVEEFEQDLLNAAEYFEKAYEVSNDADIKSNIAEYLKNIYYRFRDKDPKYQAAYDKYDAVLQ